VQIPVFEAVLKKMFGPGLGEWFWAFGLANYKFFSGLLQFFLFHKIENCNSGICGIHFDGYSAYPVFRISNPIEYFCRNRYPNYYNYLFSRLPSWGLTFRSCYLHLSSSTACLYRFELKSVVWNTFQ